MIPLVKASIESRRKTASGGKTKVLYVEDDDFNWEIAENQLGNEYAMFRAKNAQSAFAQLSANEFALILMDIQLQDSELDGLEIASIIKGKTMPRRVPDYAAGVSHPNMPIVVVTAHSGLYNKDYLDKIGIAGLIAKPVSFVSLSLMIARLVAKSVIMVPK